MTDKTRAIVKTPTAKKVAAVGNPLVEAAFRLDPLELKLILFVISLIHDEHDFYTYSFKVDDFATALGRKMTPEFYGRVRELGADIMRRILALKNFDPDDGRPPRDRDTVWFRYFDYFEGEGRVEVCLQDFLKPYLLDLKREFTKLAVKDVARLTSFYGLKLFMLLQQYRKIGHRSFLVSDLRLAMGVELHEYPEWYEFNRWVIQSAINDLRKADILEVDMTTKKRGRKIHEITFKFYAPGAEKDVTPSAEDQEKGRIITENSARYFTLLKQAQAGKLDFDENEDEEAEDQAYKALLVELKAMQKKAKK